MLDALDIGYSKEFLEGLSPKNANQQQKKQTTGKKAEKDAKKAKKESKCKKKEETASK